jgi:hypothetical protein
VKGKRRIVKMPDYEGEFLNAVEICSMAAMKSTSPRAPAKLPSPDPRFEPQRVTTAAGYRRYIQVH